MDSAVSLKPEISGPGNHRAGHDISRHSGDPAHRRLTGQNMNRSFPGSPSGTGQRKRCDLIYKQFSCRGQYRVDFHSVAERWIFIPRFASAHVLENKEQQARLWWLRLRRSTHLLDDHARDRHVGMYDTSVEDQGKTLSPRNSAAAATQTAFAQTPSPRRAGANVLKHAGIMKGSLEAASSVMLDMP